MHNIKYHKYRLNSESHPENSASSASSAPRTSEPHKVVARGATVTKNKQETLDPPPPRDISKENLGIWIGWTYRSDREVARESATKGHIALAKRFLSLRKSIIIERAAEFINSEVLLWVDELLTRKLILRISSLLENIGLDPIYELQNMFYQTKNPDRREYIGNYLKTKEVLPTNYEKLWNFLNIILQNKVLHCGDDTAAEVSIEDLEKKPDGWKEEIAAKLFLDTYDSTLVTWIKPKVLWKQLLLTNQLHLIKTWINLSFSSGNVAPNTPETITNLLKSSPLTEEMIAELSDSNMPPSSFEVILNDLALFGIFIEPEKSDFVKVLARVDAADKLLNIYEILGKTTSNIPLITFESMLVEYCLQNDLLTVMSACTANFDLALIPKLRESPHVDLLMDFRCFIENFNDNDCLLGNIYKVAKYLSQSNLEEYFNENFMIFLALLVLTPEVSLEDSIRDKSVSLFGNNLFNCLANILKHHPLLSNLYFRKTTGVKCNLTYQDLVEKHLKIDLRQVKCSVLESPKAYSKKVNFIFYLIQHRPSIASKRFFLDLLKKNEPIDAKAKSLAQNKVYKIAIKNFLDQGLTTTCVTFLNMIGAEAEHLRISLMAANILHQSGVDMHNVISLFLDNNPQIIQTLLDENLVKFFQFSRSISGGEFVRAVKTFDLVIKFSTLHNLPLPESFLRNLAQNNLWLPFLLYAQMKNYPIEQMKELCSNIKSPNLLEHVIHSVLHDIHVDETNVLMRERDPRKYLLSKIGVRRTVDSLVGPTASITSRSTVGSGDSYVSTSGSESLEIDISNTKATLLQILIRCHNSTDPPRALLQACQLYRNPLLAILATSYEPDSVITNWLTWLAVSTDLYELFTNFESISASSQKVTELLDHCMRQKFPKTLCQSCLIFVPDNPLAPFCIFLNALISKEYETEFLTAPLEMFKKLKSTRRASVLSQTDYELTYLKNKLWLETTALQLLCSALIYNTDSHYDQLRFVQILCNLDIQQYFSCETPRFHNLQIILEIIYDSPVQLDLAEFLDSTKETEAVQRCVSSLLDRHLFEAALIVAESCARSTEEIVLEKWKFLFKNCENFEGCLRECDADFEAQKVPPEAAVEFFKERKSIGDFERYLLLKYSHKWAAKHDLPTRYHLERKKILAYLKVMDKPLSIAELDEEIKPFCTYKDMLDVLETIERPLANLATDYMKELNKIQLEALDLENFWLALKLERMFGCSCNDLKVLVLCHELAEGLVLPHQLNNEQQQVVARVKEIQELTHRRRSFYRDVSCSSETYLDLIEEEPDNTIQATLNLIHLLIEKLHHGSVLAYSVFMKYRISANIEVPYGIVASNSDPLKMLKFALQDNCMNKLEVVHDFFEIFAWSKKEITDFVCDEFITAASSYSKSKIENFTMWDVKLAEQFHLILKHLKDECSTLAYKFYNFACAVHQQQEIAELNFKISEMCLVVELLVAAHSCFTADCNMEGISVVLRKCRKVIFHLLDVRSWKLIVRLLTGIGRYTELNFVFDKLKEHSQFEFLLSKGSKRDERLKLACVEYLKKHCPENKKLYELVAIHFNLYSEVAMVWEREAQGYLKNLYAIAVAEMQNRRPSMWDNTGEMVVLTKNDDTKMFLHKAMDKYVFAAEFHTQAEKLTYALNATKQAELIALQKSLIRQVAPNDTVPCLFYLSHAAVTKLMSNKLSFHESYILSQAYNLQPDWPQILYDQTITNNNISYFEEYAEFLGINDEIVKDMARKFLGNHALTENAFRNMKRIIEQVGSVHVKYQLASELGFSRMVQEIIVSGETSYLKDTVYKSGYKGRKPSRTVDK
ncbi:spatacsin [Anthonomus grandis grandis]|uniref:spatacsin n=1 Tax=Anthonomus grandis grandis TaxID=2921223 RepID=UPI002165C44A|nr:spatacsin [Anthonomus grandis grandis]